MTWLCVPIFVEDMHSAKRDIALAIESGAEMIELRMDAVPDVMKVRELEKAATVPSIITCRAPFEGGECEIDESERTRFLSIAGATEESYLDIELATLKNGIASTSNRIILSAHDFKGRPDKLYNIIEQMNARHASVNKIAWMARSIRDCQEAFELMQTRARPTIALCMGEAGLISRILAKKFGGFLTFAALRDASATAPGQPTIAQLKQIYRWDAIKPSTRVYGVIGSPIIHSMSPVVHNAAFAAAKLDSVYVPLLVNPGYESFKAFMETHVTGGGPLLLDGLSVTIPHKENALRYLRERGEGVDIDHLSRSIGAVNTIIVERNGNDVHLIGRNTDYNAILDCITQGLSISREQLKDKRIAIIGAGGTGRTAVAALAAMGASIIVYNRTIDRAEELAKEFNGTPGQVVAAPVESLSQSDCDVYVNTTSLGMFPRVDESPFGDAPPKLSPDKLVFDSVYNPPETRFLSQARTARARVIGGAEMFVRQAAAQFEFWTHRPAPVDVMRTALAVSLAAK